MFGVRLAAAASGPGALQAVPIDDLSMDVSRVDSFRYKRHPTYGVLVGVGPEFFRGPRGAALNLAYVLPKVVLWIKARTHTRPLRPQRPSLRRVPNHSTW